MTKPDPVEDSFIHLPPSKSRRLFFEKRDLPRIRDNARSPYLAPQVEEWRAEGSEALEKAWKVYEDSGDILFGMRDFWFQFERQSILQMVEPEAGREKALLEAMEKVLQLTAWDYILDGDQPIGIMRASMATRLLLFTREVLDSAIGRGFEQDLLMGIAEKGALPCYRAIYGMDHPETVDGWKNDPDHNPYGSVDMSRWPTIFSSNNLRAIPTMGVGLGALALLGRDERAGEWLQKSETSARRVLDLFMADGAYFEGMSYSNYTLNSLLAFCEAHQRLVNTIEWSGAMNWKGYLENVLIMQAGRNADGTPDVVNFSDASATINSSIPAWVGTRAKLPLAQTVVRRFCQWGSFLDFLWFEPERDEAGIPNRLKNNLSIQDWIVCRSGWEPEDAVLGFRSGFPANHEHADRNSFLFKIYGERLLNDHFGAAYNRNAPGWSLRLTRGHNAVLIDGEGHQYHDGEEGTNESQAEARVVRFEDRDSVVWWTSDATPAYQLVNPKVRRVVRTLVFAKPNILFLLDEVDLEEGTAPIQIRFFPDNRDGCAVLELQEGKFTLGRPGATLRAWVGGTPQVQLSQSSLEPMPKRANFKHDPKDKTYNEDFGDYPYVEIETEAAARHSVVTILVAQPGGAALKPEVRVEKTDRGWFCQAEGIGCLFDTSSGPYPEVYLS